MRTTIADRTNAREYVGEAMRGTLDDLRDLLRVTDADNDNDALDALGAARLESLGIESQLDAGERASAALYALPLAVEVTTTFEVVLGVGGPDRRILIECDGHVFEDDGIRGGGYEIRRIIFRYSWDGSAEVELTGEDRETAERFARWVVPELAE